MSERPDDTFQFTRPLPDGTKVRLSQAHGRTYLKIKPPGSRAWCTAPVDQASGEILAGRWALMLSNQRAANIVKRGDA